MFRPTTAAVKQLQAQGRGGMGGGASPPWTAGDPAKAKAASAEAAAMRDVHHEASILSKAGTLAEGGEGPGPWGPGDAGPWAST